MRLTGLRTENMTPSSRQYLIIREFMHRHPGSKLAARRSYQHYAKANHSDQNLITAGSKCITKIHPETNDVQDRIIQNPLDSTVEGSSMPEPDFTMILEKLLEGLEGSYIGKRGRRRSVTHR